MPEQALGEVLGEGCCQLGVACRVLGFGGVIPSLQGQHQIRTQGTNAPSVWEIHKGCIGMRGGAFWGSKPTCTK